MWGTSWLFKSRSVIIKKKVCIFCYLSIKHINKTIMQTLFQKKISSL